MMRGRRRKRRRALGGDNIASSFLQGGAVSGHLYCNSALTHALVHFLAGLTKKYTESEEAEELIGSFQYWSSNTKQM